MKNNKVVIVAGGDGGVGFSCVKAFLNTGYKVIVIDKNSINKNFFKKNNISFYKSSLNYEKKNKVYFTKNSK